MEAVVQNLERLQDVAPILPFVVEPLIEHVHDFVEVIRAELRQVGRQDISRVRTH